MTVYLSDEMIKNLEVDTNMKFSAAQKAAMRKTIRTYFVKIHLEACEATEIAKNRSAKGNSSYTTPNFTDELH